MITFARTPAFMCIIDRNGDHSVMFTLDRDVDDETTILDRAKVLASVCKKGTRIILYSGTSDRWQHDVGVQP